MDKKSLRSEYKRFRTAKTSLKMALCETLNHVGDSGVDFIDENSRPYAVETQNYKEFPVCAVRMHDNKLQVKDWDKPSDGWLNASFDWSEEIVVDLGDIAYLVLNSEIWD